MALENTTFKEAETIANNPSYAKRKEYVKYAKVFPMSEMLDFKIPSKWYRRTVGGLEMICGSAMAFWPNPFYSEIKIKGKQLKKKTGSQETEKSTKDKPFNPNRYGNSIKQRTHFTNIGRNKKK
ncbi:unnamed protein product [Diabrotica balteata]|uniref:Novel acetylcholine receptor chaperone n=1 Tax=Diabrotica balteata TaxID=107213 RepID=A0A9N9T5Q8_DIABA|nr:unnamed protein product [Diabrotica balteata]